MLRFTRASGGVPISAAADAVRRTWLAGAVAGVAGLLAPAAVGQPIYIDFGTTFGTPLDGYHAAALPSVGGIGRWNNFSVTGTSGPLMNADTGLATGVGVTISSGAFFSFNNAATAAGSNDERLMDDILDLGGAGQARVVTINNLAAGSYDIYTYASAPDSAAFITSVGIGGNVQNVGGAWTSPFAFARGITHALHHVNHPGGNLTINLATVVGSGSLNGLQILGPPSPAPPCPPGGTPVVSNTYRICNGGTNTPWSWKIVTTGPSVTLFQGYVDGVVGSDVDVANQFVNSINEYAAVAVCGTSLAAVLGSADGSSCTPSVTSTATVTITVEGVTAFDLWVGPVGNPNCLVTGPSVCTFNPTIQWIPPCPGDVNGDGEVTQADLGILLANFGANGVGYAQGDLNGDGEVTQADLSILLANFGSVCP